MTSIVTKTIIMKAVVYRKGYGSSIQTPTRLTSVNYIIFSENRPNKLENTFLSIFLNNHLFICFLQL